MRDFLVSVCVLPTHLKGADLSLSKGCLVLFISMLFGGGESSPNSLQFFFCASE